MTQVPDASSASRYAIKPRRRWRLWLGLGLLAFFVLCIGVAILFDLAMRGKLISQKQMIETTLEWGRLDPFPSSKRDFSIQAEGNIFTRTFRTRFKAPMKDIQTWLDSSPGTKGVKPQMEGSKRLYEVQPGGDAAWAQVTVDEQDESVEVYVYWS